MGRISSKYISCEPSATGWKKTDEQFVEKPVELCKESSFPSMKRRRRKRTKHRENVYVEHCASEPACVGTDIDITQDSEVFNSIPSADCLKSLSVRQRKKKQKLNIEERADLAWQCTDELTIGGHAQPDLLSATGSACSSQERKRKGRHKSSAEIANSDDVTRIGTDFNTAQESEVFNSIRFHQRNAIVFQPNDEDDEEADFADEGVVLTATLISKSGPRSRSAAAAAAAAAGGGEHDNDESSERTLLTGKEQTITSGNEQETNGRRKTFVVDDGYEATTPLPAASTVKTRMRQGRFGGAGNDEMPWVDYCKQEDAMNQKDDVFRDISGYQSVELAASVVKSEPYFPDDEPGCGAVVIKSEAAEGIAERSLGGYGLSKGFDQKVPCMLSAQSDDEVNCTKGKKISAYSAKPEIMDFNDADDSAVVCSQSSAAVGNKAPRSKSRRSTLPPQTETRPKQSRATTPEADFLTEDPSPSPPPPPPPPPPQQQQQQYYISEAVELMRGDVDTVEMQNGASSGQSMFVDDGVTDDDLSPTYSVCRSQKFAIDTSYSVTSFFDVRGRAESKNRISRLTERMDHDQSVSLLSQTDYEHQEALKELVQDYGSKLFHKWMYQLSCGLNLLLCGVGSKRRLFEHFLDTAAKDLTKVVVNGFFPDLTINNILNAIVGDLLGCTTTFQNVVDQCDFIQQTLSSHGYTDVLLVIHSVDGSPLQLLKTQRVLSRLARIPGIHIIASTDHLNVSLLWDQVVLRSFNWVCYDVSTYDNYTDEKSFENSGLVQQNAVVQFSSLMHVLHGLTPRAREIFGILATYQIEHCTSSTTYLGLSFADLYQKCRESFLVNSCLTLRAQLTEFHDHKLICRRKDIDGIEYLTIPLETSTLTEYLAQQEEN